MFKDIVVGVAGICGIVSYVPQIIKTFRTKQSADVSTSMLFILMLSAACYGVYSFYVNDIVYRLVCWLDFLFALVTTITVILYRKKS